MQILSIIIALVFLCMFGKQEEQGIQTDKYTKPSKTLQAYQQADTIHPTFPGGESALSSFLKENIVYPYNPDNRAYTGKIKVTIAIDTAGKITYYNILNSPNKDISGEIKRVVKLMPKWTPATKNGAVIADSARVWFPFVHKGE